MNYVGDYSAGSTVMIYFNTFDSNDPSASVTMTNFVNTDVHIHKNDNLTQRNNAAGITVDVDVDGIAGCHLIKIDTSDNTVADFFTAGADYGVRIEGATVDAATINPFVGHFSIENRHVAGVLVKTTIATLSSQTSFTLTAGSADDDAYNGCTIVVSDIASAVQKCVGYISDYTGSTKTVTLVADPGIFTMAASDQVSIIATSALANVQAVGKTAQTAGDIPALVTTVDTVVDGIQTDLDNGTDGLGAIKADTAAILTDTGTTLDNHLTDIKGTSFVKDTHSLTNIEGYVDLIDDGTSGLAKIATDAAAILVDTNELQTDWADGGRLDLLIDACSTHAAGDVWTSGTPIDGKSAQAAMQYMAAALAGKISGAGTGTETAVGLDAATDRVQYTVDASGNRTAVSYDP